VKHYMAKFGEEGTERCKANFNAVSEKHGAVVSVRNRSSAVWA